MPSCLSLYLPSPIDPSSFSAKHGGNASSSPRFKNSRLSRDSLEPRSERANSYKPNSPKPDVKSCYNGRPERRGRGPTFSPTSQNK